MRSQAWTRGRSPRSKEEAAQAAAPDPVQHNRAQAAAAAEGLTPARTMRIAESLYMDGLISYPRVDNTVYPASLDLRGILNTLSDVPRVRASREEGQWAASCTPARQEGDHRPPADPPHRSRRPTQAQA